jgi:hypothetical protein
MGPLQAVFVTFGYMAALYLWAETPWIWLSVAQRGQIPEPAVSLPRPAMAVLWAAAVASWPGPAQRDTGCPLLLASGHFGHRPRWQVTLPALGIPIGRGMRRLVGRRTGD